ncbi:MAG: nucleotidyl transferase AbiEii/AbiGii toxin family protein [Caldilineaceae bacterium]
MLTPTVYYFERLYPLQDLVLHLLTGLDTGFYLPGGTAVSRAYLNHRFSDDLDLFVNFDKRFTLWSNLVIQTFSANNQWQTLVTKNEEYFARIVLTHNDTTLKIEMVNDVPSHVGEIRQHPILGRIDSPENILANKLTALIGREEPRDLADVWGLCTKLGLSIRDAIEGATSKATGIYPLDLARRLCLATHKDWEQVRWIDPPEPAHYLAALNRLGEQLILV